MDRMTGSTYERARRRQAYRRLGRLIRRSPRPADLLPLEEVSRRLRAFEQSYLGIMPIEVSKIVGTVDRGGEFDRDFLPRRREIGERDAERHTLADRERELEQREKELQARLTDLEARREALAGAPGAEPGAGPPDGSGVTMMIVSIPMLLLYVGGYGATVLRKRRLDRAKS